MIYPFLYVVCYFTCIHTHIPVLEITVLFSIEWSYTEILFLAKPQSSMVQITHNLNGTRMSHACDMRVQKQKHAWHEATRVK